MTTLSLPDASRPTIGPPCLTPQGVRLRYNKVAPSAKGAAFLALTCREAMFGGAGGGGKSWTLLMAALQFADVPDYNALILRTSLRDLELADGLIDVSHKWLDGTGAKWNGNKHRWTFPSGATLEFGYMQGPNGHLRYGSSQYQFIGFDELTEFAWEEAYLGLFARLRSGKGNHAPAPDGTTLDDVPLRVRSATNPGGPGVVWVKDRFVDPEKAIRPFMPAKLTDNPGLDHDEYRRSLAELPEVRRRQMEEGDWEVYEIPGALWKFAEFQRVEVTRVDAPGVDKEPVLPSNVDVRAVSVDPSVSEESKGGDEAGIMVGSLTGGVVTIELDLSARLHPDDWATRAVIAYHEHGCSRLIVEDNQGGELVVSQCGNIADRLGLARPHVVKVKAKEPKEVRAAKVHTAYTSTPPRVVHATDLRSGGLETQMTSWVPGASRNSPDRIDAAVWLVRNLLWGEGDEGVYRTAPSINDMMSQKMPGT